MRHSPVESPIGSFSDARIMSAVWRGSDVVNHGNKLVLNRHALRESPSDMFGDVQLLGQGDWSTVLPAHHVEPLQLDAEDQWRPLDLVLLGGGDLLKTFLTLVHRLPLTEVLPSEVAAQCRLDIIGLPGHHTMTT